MKKRFLCPFKPFNFIFTMLCVLFLGLFISMQVYADEPLVIVIDPGHGGENLGAEYDGYTEKEITLPMAIAMKEELETYDNVVVYLTREDDRDLSIKERAEFAKEVNADFLFCLHFNASVSHNLFGAEVWVPSEGEYYSKGYAFSEILMSQFEEMGLYSRGIKTRLNDDGIDYYGILRYCTSDEVAIPAVLIEHCHLDNEKDKGFYQKSEEQLWEFGRQDALAVAKYFGLTSSRTGKDFSDYSVSDIPVPKERVAPDKTAPEVCNIEVIEVNKETGEATIKINASDRDSFILYFNYSLDGGKTYSPLKEWPRPTWNESEREHTVTVTLPYENEIELRIRTYNGFDVWTESKSAFIGAIEDPVVKKEKAAEAERLYKERAYEEISLTDKEALNKSPLWPVIAGITGIVFCMFLTVMFLTRNIFRLLDSNNKR